MKIRFTLATKLGLGFGLLIAAIIVNSVLTYNTLSRSRTLSNRIISVYNPSLMLVEQYQITIVNSKALISNWIFVQSNDNSPEKGELRKLIDSNYVELNGKLMGMSEMWETNAKLRMDTINSRIDSLFTYHRSIMNTLNSFESYDDPMVIFEVRPMVEEGGVILSLTDDILERLELLTEYFESQVNTNSLEMISSFDRFKNFIITMSLILLIVGLATASLTINNIRRPIQYLKNILLEMAKGKLPSNKLKHSSDEIGEISDAVNQLLDSRKETAEFAVEIGEGNLNAEFTPLSNDDVLGNALIEMRNSLIHAKTEEEKRKIEDEKRSWATHGIARFAEILRTDNDDLAKLSYSIIYNLVEYIKANVGGLFILSDETDQGEEYMELAACYAYDRRKYNKKKVFIGEGLVGACYQEQQTIYITEVPNDYINITSGLGTRNPSAVLLVPLKLNDEIYGVIELASFSEFEKYVIEFVEKIGESIASTISSVRINMRTAKLLEQSQQQAEEMRAQEEEMRQNMEELHATQEEMSRKNAEIEGTMRGIYESFAIIEFDMTETFIEANDAFYRLSSLTEADLKDRKHREFLTKEIIQSGEYDRIWDRIRRGESNISIFVHNFRGKKVYTREVLTPIKNADGVPYKLMILMLDVTEQRIYTQNLEHKIDEFTKSKADSRKDDDDDLSNEYSGYKSNNAHIEDDE